MSSCFYVTGFFPLANGRQDRVVNGSGRPNVFAVYDSTFPCADQTRVPVTIRTFAGNAPICPDYTVAWIVAKGVIPQASSDTITFHAVYFSPVPGDPSSEDYDASVPNFIHPVIFAVGHVLGTQGNADPNSPPSFTMSTSSYVNNSNLPSFLRGAFVNRRRWANIPALSRSSCIAVLGTAHTFTSHPANQLCFAVDDLSLNLSPSTASGGPSPIANTGSTPSTARRFNPFLSGPLASSATSGASASLAATAFPSAATLSEESESVDITPSPAMSAGPVPSTPAHNASPRKTSTRKRVKMTRRAASPPEIVEEPPTVTSPAASRPKRPRKPSAGTSRPSKRTKAIATPSVISPTVAEVSTSMEQPTVPLDAFDTGVVDENL